MLYICLASETWRAKRKYIIIIWCFIVAGAMTKWVMRGRARMACDLMYECTRASEPAETRFIGREIRSTVNPSGDGAIVMCATLHTLHHHHYHFILSSGQLAAQCRECVCHARCHHTGGSSSDCWMRTGVKCTSIVWWLVRPSIACATVFSRKSQL